MIDYKIGGLVAGAAFLLSFLLGLMGGSRPPKLILNPLFFAFVFFGIAVFIKYLVARFLPELLEKGSVSNTSRRSPGSRVNITEDFSSGDSSAYMQDSISQSYSAANAAVPNASGMGSGASGETLGNISSLLRKKASGETAPPGTPSSDQGLGNISDLLRKKAASEIANSGMDQKSQSGYNGTEEGSVPESATEKSPDSSGDVSVEIPMWDFDKGLGALPNVPVVENTQKSVPVFEEPRESKESSPAFSTGSEEISGGTDALPDLDSMAGAFGSGSSNDEPVNSGYSSGGYQGSAPTRRRSSGASDASWSGDFNPKDIAKGLQTVLIKDKEG